MKKRNFRIQWVLILLLFTVVSAYSQRTALLIIDMQMFYFPGGDMHLENPEKAGMNAGLLLQEFRKQGDPVIHVRHLYEPGGNFHNFVQPREGEVVVEKEHVNAFLDTELDKILKELSVTSLVICGMQTHMCVEAAVRAASDKGYRCTLVEDACATRTLQYGSTIVSARDVHVATLASLKSYAEICTAGDYLIRMAEMKEEE